MTVQRLSIIFLLIQFCCCCNSHCQPTYGLFISPTVGLDVIENEYYRILVHGFGNDRWLPLMGVQAEYGESFCTWVTRFGCEPIVNVGSYYGASVDVFQQLRIGKSWFKPTIGVGSMFRTLDHFSLRQTYLYCAVAPEFVIRKKISIEPAYCFGIMYEITRHPLLNGNSDGRYLQDWLRINLIYHF
ncbi:MAG: hypothetical protein IPM74_11560 [Crocinitomicaceae bacterium]|nr:hypothetical protein [Crocinitomicaceae bacterium]MBK8926516.1 hypothetical protein [Crocinitomicaceae bacterium]